MTRFSPGIYSIVNRYAAGATANITYILDNVNCSLYGDTMVVVIVKNWLGLPLLPDSNIIVNKVGQLPESVIGNTSIYTS